MPNPNITSTDLEAMGLKVFDPAEYITSDEAAVAYLNEALAENDAALLASALGDVARARHGRDREGGRYRPGILVQSASAKQSTAYGDNYQGSDCIGIALGG